MKLFWSKYKINNVGDKLTPYLYKKMTGKSPTYIDIIRGGDSEHVVGVGSILHYANKNSIIWGSGFIDKDSKVPRVKKVLSVRGPLTRNKLISNNIDCPDIYGDPGLLVSMFYTPTIERKYIYGYIPHYVDKNNDVLLKLINNTKDYTIIDIEDENIENFIDRINECEYIISSSLHGVILSDAYNIPNVAIKVSNNVVGNGFKFYDYFDSVKRGRDNYIIVDDCLSDDEIDIKLFNYKRPIINKDKIIDVCPWNNV